VESFILVTKKGVWGEDRSLNSKVLAVGWGGPARQRRLDLFVFGKLGEGERGGLEGLPGESKK